MRQCHADARNKQYGEIPRQSAECVAGDEKAEEDEQQGAPLPLRQQQHAGQRGKRHDPGIHRQHHPGLRRVHAEAGADVGEQRDGDKFGGVEDKGGNGEGQYARPGETVRGVVQGYGSTVFKWHYCSPERKGRGKWMALSRCARR